MTQQRLSFSVSQDVKPQTIKRGLDRLAALLRAESGRGTSASAFIERIGVLAGESPEAALRIAMSLADVFGVDVEAPWII